jgi:uncharacterized membrane protein
MLLQVLPLLLVLVTDPAPAADPRRAPASMADETARLLSTSERRVRSGDSRLVDLIDSGVERSYSFAELVRDLHYTDVIVYIEAVQALPPFVDGHTFLVTSRDGRRYLRIQLRQGLPADETIALLAHELRHALEVAVEPTVRTAKDFSEFYRRIGQAVPGVSRRYDTRAAQDMGRMVRRELR